MRFTAKTEEQLQEENLLPLGWYDFEVLEAHHKISKAAQARGETEPNMIHLKLRVYETPERGVFVDDYLLEEMAFKLLHFCSETGLMAAYSSGQLTPEMCVGKAGRVKIGPSKPKGTFKAKDEVKDYGEKESASPQKQAGKISSTPPPASQPEDDIPW
jgi:hypothetical protein